jgi:hypothetical protein
MSWSAWKLDMFTWGWIVWLAFFAVWETMALMKDETHTLTFHLRPLFVEHPTTWFLALGLWLWLGVHFLAPALEWQLIRLVKGG